MYVLALWSVLLALGAKGTAAGAHGIVEKAGFASGRVSRRGRLLAGGVKASFVRRDLDMRGNRHGPGCLNRKMEGAPFTGSHHQMQKLRKVQIRPKIPEIQVGGKEQEQWHAQVNTIGQDWHYNSLLLAAGKLVTLHLPRGQLVPGPRVISAARQCCMLRAGCQHSGAQGTNQGEYLGYGMQYQDSDQSAMHCSDSQFAAFIPFTEEASGNRLPPLSSYQEHYQAQRGKVCKKYEVRWNYLPCEI